MPPTTMTTGPSSSARLWPVSESGAGPENLEVEHTDPGNPPHVHVPFVHGAPDAASSIVEQRHPRALRREAPRRLATHAAAAAGDDGHSVVGHAAELL